jgi:hypothetical protein
MPQCQFPIFCSFVFQKSYTANILKIGQNKSRISQYLTKLPEVRRGDGGGPQAGHTTGRRSLTLAVPPGGEATDGAVMNSAKELVGV